MELSADSKLLRIFIGEIDKTSHQPLYEALLFAARERGLAGCTIIKDIRSYGASSHVHTAKLIDISEDRPIIIEIVDKEEKINAFLVEASDLFEKSECEGLI